MRGKPSKKYTLEPGRAIYRNDMPFIVIGGDGNYRPYEVDRLAHRVVELLNEHGFECPPAWKATKP